MAAKLTIIGSRQFYLWQPDIDIFLNESKLGKISLRDTLTFDIPDGTHTLYVKGGLLSVKSNRVQFTARDGDVININFKTNRLTGEVVLEKV